MHTHDEAPGLLTISETARRLRLSEATTHRLINAGLLPTIAVSDRRRVVSAADLDNYLARRRVSK